MGADGGRQRFEPKRFKVSRDSPCAHSAIAWKLQAPDKAAHVATATNDDHGMAHPARLARVQHGSQ